MSGALVEATETCVVCFKNVSLLSVGKCDHPVCYECSTRMRVLCRQNECPICRQDMPKVVFTKKARPFKDIISHTYPMDKKFKICFESLDIQAAYDKLLEHVCTVCWNKPAFRTFHSLKDHMRKEHELQYCDLCVANLNIFTAERRCYTRPELALHRRKGDPDNRSHRGHPMCEFCQQRYMDNDELFRHLRRDHLFCHFCDADGYHRFYSTYECLREHFSVDHFLCEEGDCINEKFTSVFRSEIDLKAHRALVHGRTMGKAAAKQARTLELEFTLAPRTRDRDRKLRDRQESETVSDVTSISKPNTTSAVEFPSLGEPHRPTSAVTIRTCRQTQPPLAVTDENFPVLTSNGTTTTKTLRLSVNSGSQELLGTDIVRNGSSKPTNLSIHVNHHPGGMVTKLSSAQNVRIRPTRTDEDFPSLPTASKPTTHSTATAKRQLTSSVQPAKSIEEASGVSRHPLSATSRLTIPVEHGNGEMAVLSNIKVKSKKKKTKNHNPIADQQVDERYGTTNSATHAAKNISGTEEFEQLLKQQLMLQDVHVRSNGINDDEIHTSGNMTERKRSELLVGKLCQGEINQRFSTAPTSHEVSSPPPPGFSSMAMSRGPPPGFSVTLNSVARSQPSRLTFTSSNGHSYPITSQGVTTTTCAYYPPLNFEHRNEVLMFHVVNSLQDNCLEQFRDMSKKFRQGNMSAEKFYILCKDMMGQETFLQIFPELIVLLPDIAKQQELWKVHVSKTAGARLRQDLEVCKTCSQVISHSDSQHHATSHTLEDHFPTVLTVANTHLGRAN